MMHRLHGLAWIAALAFAVGGCGDGRNEPAGSTSGQGAGGPSQWVGHTDSEAVAVLEGPQAAVYEFLEAIRSGDDRKATDMLTTVAREKWGELGRSLNPPASDTARFEIGGVEYLAEDGARVACRWTDLDENGQLQTDDSLWMVRRESAGWRIAGTATVVFEGEPPLLLDYEDPEDTLRQLQMVHEEILRRAAQQQQRDLEARLGETTDSPIRR